MAFSFQDIDPGLSHALGMFGIGGGSDYQRPPGTIGTDQVLKFLNRGMNLDQIMAMGPMSSRHIGRSQNKLMKAGLTPEQIQQLRGGGFGIGAGGAGAGPMGMDPFQAMLPSLFGQSALFSNPAASQWLQSLFQTQQQQQPQVLGAPMPFEGPGIPNFGPQMPQPGKGRPGPAPNPFVGLRSLSGPFGNGGGALTPFQPGKSRFF